jgi:hypothetical protein
LAARRTGLVFAALSLFFLGATFLWLRLDRTPPSWDDAFYLSSSLQMFDALVEGGLASYGASFLRVMATKPPLIAILPTPIYLIAGRHAHAAYAVNLISLLILLAALYQLGKRYASRRAGLLAVYIAGTIPVIYGLARWYLVECSLMAIVCVIILLLATWDDSSSLRNGFLVGILVGLGLLMKVSFPLYVAAPILCFAARTRGAILRPKVLLAAAVPAVLLAAPWYLFNIRLAIATALEAGSDETAKLYRTGDVLSLSTIGRYFYGLINAGPALYFIALLLLLLTMARKAPPAAKAGLQLCAVWTAPLLFLLFGRYRELRYASPLYPAIALALGILIDAALERRAVIARTITYGLLALPMLGMLQNSFRVFGSGGSTLSRLLLVESKLAYARPYDPRPWPQQQIMADIYRLTRFSGGERKPLMIGTDSRRFNADNFRLSILEQKLPFDVVTTAYETNLQALLAQLDSAAYFIYKEGGERVAPFFNTRGGAVLKQVRESGRFRELPIARALPDDGIAHVFANRSPGRFQYTGAYLRPGFDAIPEAQVTFAGKLQLTGVSARRATDGLEVKYRWRCLKPPDRDYWCFTHVVDSRDRIVGYLDHPVLNADPPMTMWQEGDVAVERLLLPAAALREGESYHLRLGLFHKESRERLLITASDLPLADRQTAVLVDEAAPSP